MIPRSKKPTWQRRIARERIEILFDLAKKELKKHPERSKRYIELARKIGVRYNIRLERLKRKFCKNCNSLLIPGYNSEVKIDSKRKEVIIKCKNCNKIYKVPYKS